MMKDKLMSLVRRSLLLFLLPVLSGCTLDVLDPRGPVGRLSRNIIVIELGIMLCIVIPVIVMTLWFAYKYRETNPNAAYLPDWNHSLKIEVAVWGIPAVAVAILGALAIWSSYVLDPYRPLSPSEGSGRQPLNVEVVALNWKWLFIYPDQGIATINQLAVPVNTPINFRITSDTVMTSFFIPRLGSQIYAMAGMQTQLHLLASTPGDYRGEAAHYSGKGFSDMKFRTLVMKADDFNDWVAKVKSGSATLDAGDYQQVAAYEEAAPVRYFAHVQPNLFDGIVAKYNDGMVIDKSTGQVMHMHSAVSDMKMKE